MYSGRDLMIDGDAALLRSSFVPQIKRVFYIYRITAAARAILF